MRRLYIFVVVLVLIVIGSTWFVNKYFAIEAHAIVFRLFPPPTLQQVEKQRLRKIAGMFSRDCGHVRRHDDASTAMACATTSMRSRHPFRVGFEWTGLDSHGITGLAGNANGEVYEVTVDETDAGGGILLSAPVREITVTRCERMPVEITVGMYKDRLFSCVRSSSDSTVY
jgi:hypothetical protein